jgi:uncharacterized protein
MIASVPMANRPADAAGFDCKRAKSLVEKQICGVPEFSKQDGEIALLYTRTLAALSKDDAGSLREEQRAWVKEREACEDMIHGDPVVMADVLGCIRRLMGERKARLQAIFERKQYSK